MTEADRMFEEYREYLKMEISRLASYAKLFRHLHDLRANHLDTMNLAPAFFQVTMSALFTAIVIWTDTLLGTRSQRSLRHLLTFIEHNRSIFSIDALKKRRGYRDDHWMLNREPVTMDTIRGHRDRLDGLASLESFKTRRDQFHAHFDKKYFFDRESLQKDAPLTWSDLDEVMEVASEILNHYSTAYDGNTYKLLPDNITDVDLLLDRAAAAPSENQR